MEDKLNKLRKAMDSTTHKGNHFTEVQKNNIRKELQLNDDSNHQYHSRKYTIYALTAAAVIIFALLISTEFLLVPSNNGTTSPIVEDWEPRHEYREGDQLLFSVYPNPGLTAERPLGYIFHFTEPFDVFYEKELAIYASHQETGQRITLLSPKTITEGSSGYSSLERFTAILEVPEGGLWRYEVYLDNQFYGDVILYVHEIGEVVLPENIPSFVKSSDFSFIDWDKKAVEFGGNMIGNVNKSGVIGADMPSLTEQKWMWHLWGVENVNLTVVGYHKKTETVHSLLKNGWTIDYMAGENKDADTHAPSTVQIPLPGEWAILLYTDGELFDILVLEIDQ